MNKYTTVLYKEPLEQFEIFKIGLWTWQNNCFLHYLSNKWGAFVNKFYYFFDYKNILRDYVYMSTNYKSLEKKNSLAYVDELDIFNYWDPYLNVPVRLFCYDFKVGGLNAYWGILPRPGLSGLTESTWLNLNYDSKSNLISELPNAPSNYSYYDLPYRLISPDYAFTYKLGPNSKLYFDTDLLNISTSKYSQFIFNSFDGWMLKIYPLTNYSFPSNFSIDNTTLFGLLIIIIISGLFIPITNNLNIISYGWQNTVEKIYYFIIDMVKNQIGNKAQKFIPYIFTIFIFILISNILGMALFSFTLTSHVMVTFTLGVSTFIGLTLLAIWLQGTNFINLFIPSGIPMVLLPMLFIIEVVSYFSRALSLSIRLFANLMSGHTLLHILAFFSSKIMNATILIGLVTFVLILGIVVLEFGIACLQAYVFTILVCIYLNDAYNIGH